MPTQVTATNLHDQALAALKELGYWQPLPGSKAHEKAQKSSAATALYFHYYFDPTTKRGTCAFAVDVATLRDYIAVKQKNAGQPPHLKSPLPKVIVHAINSEQDLPVYESRAECLKSIQAGYCLSELADHEWIVVKRPELG